MQNSPDQSQPDEIAEARAGDGSEAGIGELHRQVASTEARILDLERELDGVVANEARLADDLAAERARRSALDHQLGEAREDASRFALEVALETRRAAAAEAEQMLADAQRESEALVDAGLERLRTAESEASGRLAELETRRSALSEQLQVMEVLYAELQSTLQLIAETSVNELTKARDTLQQLDPSGSQRPVPESAGELTTTSDPDDEPVPEGETRHPEDDEPHAIAVPPLSGGA